MPDFPRLADAIQARATALGWRQRDLIQRTHLSRETVVSLWRGDRLHIPSSSTQRAVEELLGWESGSVDTVLAGGDPTVLRDETQVPDAQVDDLSPPARGAGSPTFPMRVQLALEEGRPLDYDVLEFEIGGERLSVIAWAQTGVYDTEEKRAVLREQLETFHRMMGHIRREGEGSPEGESVTEDT